MAAEPIPLFFNIFPDEVKVEKGYNPNEPDILAEVRHTNQSKNDMTFDEELFFAIESEGDNFIEAYDLQDNKIFIDKSVHIQILFDPETLDPFYGEVTIKPNETKTDTINIATFYQFKQKGIFKARFVNKQLNLVSNWDTLVVN